MTHYIFAGLIVLFKLALKISTSRSMNKVDIFRAALNFPLDLAFLGLSFGVIYILSMQRRVGQSASAEAAITVFLAYIVFASLVALACRRSDSLFHKDEEGKPIVWAAVNYFATFLVLAISIYIQ
ncbi:hypothetical protein PO002_42000 [Cupriavidus necator]|uniref:hypothetical protein n=1 Tax=Cupriavidus necator TaxID=106590 RepID=UPI0039C024DF